ncbi:MAG: InlB B-repeat-containing protein [Paludibacteraceae bacterium]|nr:InlB B-repeat-containing protein [Paludibacteraceae bacterium]
MQIPVSNAVKVKIERWSSDKSGYWNTNIELTAGTAGNHDCVYCTAYAVGEWRTQGSGSITTDCGGSGGGGSDPTPIETHYIAGEGWTGSTWNQKDLAMTALGSDMAYYLIPAEKITGQIKFKLNPASDPGNWSKQLNSNNIDNAQAYSNVNLTSVDDQRLTLSTNITSAKKNDIYVFTNGTKVWAIAVPIYSSQLPDENTAKPYTMMDLRLNDNNEDWKGYSNATRFTDKANDNNSYTKHTLAYIIPAVGSGETNSDGAKVRIEYYDASQTCKKSNKTPGIPITSSPKRAIVLWDGSSTSPADPLIVDCPVRKSGWKLYVNGSLAGTTDANGDVLVSNLASGNVTFYLTNGEASKLYQGINWFGGLYINRSSCSGVTLGSQQYGKGSGKNGVYTKPIVGAHEPQGKFTLSQASDVTFNFDGGDITLTATAAAPPAVTYTVTIHPNNGGSNIVRSSVPEGSNSSAAALNLSSITYGAGTATWYTDEDCTTPFSTVTGDMDLYAKWGVSGNFYFVSCMQTANDGGGESGNWSNDYGKKLTHTFIAPSGHMPFEVIKDKDWNQKINGGNYADMFDNSKSNVTISAAHGHMDFTLSEPKQVTVAYNGKVSVNVANYSFDNSRTWRIKTSWGNGGAAWNYNTYMTNNGTTNATAILRNVPAGQNSFVVTTTGNDNDAMASVGTETFNALYVDTSNPSSGLTWNNTSARRDGSDNFNSTTPQTDNRWRNCSFSLSAVSDIRITFDGGKIRCDILPKYTVTFNSDGGSEVASQTMFEGLTASEPSAPTKAGYEFVKWQLSGTDYDFSSAVTGNITLDAVWAYKAISSVALNESEHTTWVGNSDFTLTPTLDPTDGIAKSVVWSSSADGVATVSNGTVHAVAAGDARITVTVTDQFNTVRTAYCDVTVAACQMTTDELYSMTVTGYNSSTGSSATLNGLWNQAVDNTEPASMTITRLAFQKKDAGTTLYAYDDNGTVKVKEDASGNDVQWILIPVESTVTPSWNSGNACQLYYIKNKVTGAYMHRGSTGVSTGNEDWRYSVTNTNTTNAATDDYKWFIINENDNQRCIFVKSGIGSTKAHSYKLHTSNQYNDCTDTYAAKPYLPVGCTADINAYAKSYKNTNDFNYDTYNNPNYVLSQVNTSYYRMNTDATVQANLDAALVKGAIITVNLYADAATSVKLTKTDGTEIATINLNADAALEYSYTVNAVSALLGQSAFVIKAADNHAAIASIAVARTYAASPSTPDLVWESDLSSGVSQSVMAGNFVHTASSLESSGAISYTSSNTSVATVASDGTVTPKAEGPTTITATIEAAGCYAEYNISYNLTVTGATLAELIAANSELTLQYNYNEDAVINKTITIDGNGHSIGNLTIETAGDLTLTGNLTVKDFTICAKAGNTSINAASGQVRNANYLTSIGNAYFLYTVDPSGQVQYGWYDFTVPFPVNVMTGIKGIQNEVLKENFANEVDYAIMEYLGDKQAQGQYPYKKFRGVMQPNKLYSITLDDEYNYNTVRFQKTSDGALVASNSVTLNEYLGDGTHDNWNGVGNGTLHHADAGVTSDFIQVYQNGDKSFLAVSKNEYSLVVGSAFMVQETGSMMLNQATHIQLLAPSRATSTPDIAVQIAREGQPFSDQLFISASETGGQAYTQGVDLAKAGDFGKANVPQIGTNAYNTLLCVHEAQLIGGQAEYALSLYAPANGTYMLTSKNIPEDKSIYLTQNGNTLCNLSDSYALDLTKGITTEYGLLLVETHKVPTDVDNVQSDNVQSTKIIRNGMLYILRNGEIFNAQGARVQ